MRLERIESRARKDSCKTNLQIEKQKLISSPKRDIDQNPKREFLKSAFTVAQVDIATNKVICGYSSVAEAGHNIGLEGEVIGISATRPVSSHEKQFIRRKWTEQEKNAFVRAHQIYGTDWKSIAGALNTRNTVQVEAYGQKFLRKKEQEMTFRAKVGMAYSNSETAGSKIAVKMYRERRQAAIGCNACTTVDFHQHFEIVKFTLALHCLASKGQLSMSLVTLPVTSQNPDLEKIFPSAKVTSSNDESDITRTIANESNLLAFQGQPKTQPVYHSNAKICGVQPENTIPQLICKINAQCTQKEDGVNTGESETNVHGSVEGGTALGLNKDNNENDCSITQRDDTPNHAKTNDDAKMQQVLWEALHQLRDGSDIKTLHILIAEIKKKEKECYLVIQTIQR